MRHVVLGLIVAAVLLVPREPASAIVYSYGDLLAGTRVIFDLRTDGFPRTTLDVRIAAPSPGLIGVGEELVSFEFPAMLRKPLVTNVPLDPPTVTIVGGLPIGRLTEKQASHKVPWLSTTPVLGELFRSEVETTTRSLLVFVSPQIVVDPEKSKEVEGHAGDFRIDDAKGKGSVRIVKGFTKYKGAWTWKIRGTWLDGPAAGKSFRATVKGKLTGERS